MTIRSAVFEILSSHSAVVAVAGRVIDDAPLGEDGLGLDSISIADVLLACEDRFGTPARELLGVGALTVGRLIEHLEAPSRG
jgi:acyl carrier protein